MTEIFIKIFNMSISAGWLVLCVVALRLILKKAPRWIACVLWAMVAVRLLCPFSVESVLSLIPSAETIPEDIVYQSSPEIHSGISVLNSTVNPIISESLAPVPESSVDVLEVITLVATLIWLIGMAAMAVYAIVSYIKVRARVREAATGPCGIWLCDRVDTPFILGLFRPRIYLPSTIGEEEREYIIAHERAHLSRWDHVWKPVGFLLLTVYWFNPLMWVAYIFLCRDIEIACDEKVIKKLGESAKKPYAEALINCSAQRRMISACPLAFGENGVRGRVKSVLSYKKPAFWVIIAAVLSCVAVGVFFLTDPVSENAMGIEGQKCTSELEGLSLEITDCELSAPDPYITVEWKNMSGKDLVYGGNFYVYRYEDGQWEDCRINENYAWNTIAYYAHSGKTVQKKYHLNGLTMSQTGKYRFETDCFAEGVPDTKFKVCIEFELKQGVDLISVHTFDPVELVYDHPMYSYVQSAEAAPKYQIVNNMQLYELHSSGIMYELGYLEETELSENNFDRRFSDYDDSWSGEEPAASLRKNNKRAWELYSPAGDLYMLLLQKDGTYYLCVAFEGTSGGEPTDSSGYHFRWVYRLNESEGTSGNSVEQSARDGALFLYKEKTPEHNFPEYKKYYQLTNDELSRLFELLEKKKWHDDRLTDRISFDYDGQIYYDGMWLYFGYDQEVFYYNEYFCENADDAISYVKKLAKKAKAYKMEAQSSSTWTLGDDVDVFSYTDSPELYPPTIMLSDDNKFQFTCSLLSSDLIIGTYELTDEELILTTDDESPCVYVFRVVDENTFAFVEKRSSKISSYRYGEGEEPRCPVPDGAEFKRGTALEGISVMPMIDSIEHDLNGDGYPEECTMTYGPTSGVVSIKLHVVDGKDSKEYSQWWTIDYNSPAFWIDGDGALCINGERQIGYDDGQGEYEICVFDVALEGEEIRIAERNVEDNVSFLRVYDVDDDIHYDSVTEAEQKEVLERMYELFGKTDTETGFEYSFVVDGAVEIGDELFYLLNRQWIVEDEEGMLHHASTISTYVISKDLFRMYEAYFEDDGILKVYNKRNIINQRS